MGPSLEVQRGHGQSLWAREAGLGSFLAAVLTGSVTLNHGFNLHGPQFPHLGNKSTALATFEGPSCFATL